MVSLFFKRGLELLDLILLALLNFYKKWIFYICDCTVLLTLNVCILDNCPYTHTQLKTHRRAYICMNNTNVNTSTASSVCIPRSERGINHTAFSIDIQNGHSGGEKTLSLEIRDMTPSGGRLPTFQHPGSAGREIRTHRKLTANR